MAQEQGKGSSEGQLGSVIELKCESRLSDGGILSQEFLLPSLCQVGIKLAGTLMSNHRECLCP